MTFLWGVAPHQTHGWATGVTPAGSPLQLPLVQQQTSVITQRLHHIWRRLGDAGWDASRPKNNLQDQSLNTRSSCVRRQYIGRQWRDVIIVPYLRQLIFAAILSMARIICFDLQKQLPSIRNKCAKKYNKWHSKFIFLNCNQHFGNFKP